MQKEMNEIEEKIEAMYHGIKEGVFSEEEKT